MTLSENLKSKKIEKKFENQVYLNYKYSFFLKLESMKLWIEVCHIELINW